MQTGPNRTSRRGISGLVVGNSFSTHLGKRPGAAGSFSRQPVSGPPGQTKVLT